MPVYGLESGLKKFRTFFFSFVHLVRCHLLVRDSLSAKHILILWCWIHDAAECFLIHLYLGDYVCQ